MQPIHLVLLSLIIFIKKMYHNLLTNIIVNRLNPLNLHLYLLYLNLPLLLNLLHLVALIMVVINPYKFRSSNNSSSMTIFYKFLNINLNNIFKAHISLKL